MRIGIAPASAGRPSVSVSNMLITTRTFGNKALRSAHATLRKYLINTEPGRILRRTRSLRSRCESMAAAGLVATNKTTSS